MVAVNSVDYSIKVFRLLANGAHQVVSEAAGDQAWAWRFEFTDRSIITSSLSLKQFDVSSMQPCASDIHVPIPKFAHSLAIVSLN